MTPTPLPRLVERRPREGHVHPAVKGDIARVLRFFGEPYLYGLRSIELVQQNVVAGDNLLMGRLVVPGRIILYDQPPSPWLLPRGLSAKAIDKLYHAGAVVEEGSPGAHTVVSWPGATLRDYMLFDVLMHEIGHHLIQQYTGKRRARVVRTKDHEAFAGHVARQCRLLYESRDDTASGGATSGGTASL